MNSKSTANHNPITLFQQWFYEVEKQHPEDEINAMTLGTIGVDGFPKSRIVLLKRFTWEGFIFFTNYTSEKGKAINKNNNVTLLFNWSTANRQVNISGKAEKIPENLSEGYFESRPEGSKLSAWASPQSDVIPSRKFLEDRLKEYDTKFRNTPIPKPEYWGGYIIKPKIMTFTENDSYSNYRKTKKYMLQKDYNWSMVISYAPT